jgi:hypothetical protein
MICFRCDFPLDIQFTVEPNCKQTLTDVKCKHCGAVYQVGIVVRSEPTISPAKLEQIRNKPA